MASSKMIYTKDGKLPLEDNPPSYDKDTQYLMDDGFDVLADKAVRRYKIIDYEVEKQSNEEILLEKIEKQDTVMQELMFNILPLIGGGGGE